MKEAVRKKTYGIICVSNVDDYPMRIISRPLLPSSLGESLDFILLAWEHRKTYAFDKLWPVTIIRASGCQNPGGALLIPLRFGQRIFPPKNCSTSTTFSKLKTESMPNTINFCAMNAMVSTSKLCINNRIPSANKIDFLSCFVRYLGKCKPSSRSVRFLRAYLCVWS